MRPYHAGAASAALAACPSTTRVQGCMPGTPVAAGQTPTYIVDDIQLVTDSDRIELRSATARVQPPPGPFHGRAQLWRSKLQCCRPARVEQFTAAPATTRRDMNFARFKRQLKTFGS